jgi:hypothetical protein
MEGWRKTTYNLGQDSQCLSQDLKPVTSQIQVWRAAARPTSSVPSVEMFSSLYRYTKLMWRIWSLKRIIFWDVTPCSLLRCNRRFGGTYRLHLQGRRHLLAEIFSSTLKMEAICSPKRRLHLNRLHGVTSQKMILFITTAVKTSNPT